VKICTKCLRRLPLSHYHQDLTCRFGLKTRCKDCERERHRLWREANPEKKAAANRRYLESSDPTPTGLQSVRPRGEPMTRCDTTPSSGGGLD